MAETALPLISAARQLSRASTKPKTEVTVDDQSVAVNALCKTLNATVTKLFFSLSALQAASSESKSTASSSIANALAANKRDELVGKIIESLANTVERVVKCEKASVRSSVIRDIRARFDVKSEQARFKPEMIDAGVQCVRKTKKEATAETAQDDLILRALRGEAPAPSTAAPPAPTQGPGPGPVPATASSTAAAAPSSSARRASAPPSTSATPPAAAADKSRPVSAALPGIYERQMQWAARAAARMEQMRADKENKEREAEQPVRTKASLRWGHVESVMRKQRLESEESWRSDLKERMQSEIDRREQMEQRVREERAEKEKAMLEKERADEMRMQANLRAEAASRRAAEAESKLLEAKATADEQAKAHAHELEIRDAFGERGLEEWPMFPGRKVFRVLESEHFDGRISAEFRVKDAESGERGVTLLMGRLAHSKAQEAQAVLFDTKWMNDLQAARWWQSNGYRFEKAKERALAATQRAASAGASRTRAVSAAQLADLS